MRPTRHAPRLFQAFLLALLASGGSAQAAQPKGPAGTELRRTGKTAERRIYLVADHLAQFSGYRQENGRLVAKNPLTVGLSGLEPYYAKGVTPAGVLAAMFGPGEAHYRSVAGGTQVLWGASLEQARPLGVILGRGRRAQFVPTTEAVRLRNQSIGEALIKQLNLEASDYRRPDPARSWETTEDGLYRTAFETATYHWKTGERVYNSIPPSSGMLESVDAGLPEVLRRVLRPAKGRKGRAGSPYAPSDAEVALALERPEFNRANENERPLPVSWRSRKDAKGNPLPEGQWAQHRLLVDGGIAKYSVAVFGPGLKNAVQARHERNTWVRTQKRALKRKTVPEAAWQVADDFFRRTELVDHQGQPVRVDSLKGLDGYWAKFKTPSHWMSFVFGRGALRLKKIDGEVAAFWDKQRGGSQQVGWMREKGGVRYFEPLPTARNTRDRVIGELIVTAGRKDRDVRVAVQSAARRNEALPADVAERDYYFYTAGDRWSPKSVWSEIRYSQTISRSGIEDLIAPIGASQERPVVLTWDSSRAPSSGLFGGENWMDYGREGKTVRHALWITNKEIIHRVDVLKLQP